MISIIIPAYNEEKRIKHTLQIIRSYLGKKDYEIIVVDDGSTDLTPKIASRYAHVISLKQNKGKGFAVKTGFTHAKGSLILFSDADLATPISELDDMVSEMLHQKADIVIASRYLKSHKHVDQTIKRKIVGFMFALFQRILVQLKYKDTQCGFKLYTKESVALIVKKQQIDRFAFDVEHLVIAQKNKLKVIEHPVSWYDKTGSTVRIFRDGFRMFKDILVIRKNAKKGFYS